MAKKTRNFSKTVYFPNADKSKANISHNMGVEKYKLETPELDPRGSSFLKFAEEQNVDLNAFFRMWTLWAELSANQKNAVIIEGVKTGRIVLEDENEKQGSESE